MDLRFPSPSARVIPPEEMYFSGRIVDATGRPIDGGVRLYDVDLGQVVSNASADVVGRFRVKALTGRRYRIRAMACGDERAVKLQSEDIDLPEIRAH